MIQLLAQSSETAREGLSFVSLLFRGGWLMIPLGLLSILVIAIGIERLITLRRSRLFPGQLVEQLGLLSKSPAGFDPRRVYKICQAFPSVASTVMRSVLTKVGRSQFELERAVNESAQREATRLSYLTSWLSLFAAVAPLIGLLGTVLGITEAFFDMTQIDTRSTNPGTALAGGIYVALVTTIAGLFIAIPATIMAHFFDNRVVKRMNEIEEMVCNLLPQFEKYEGQVRFAEKDHLAASDPLTESNQFNNPLSPLPANAGRGAGGEGLNVEGWEKS